MAHMKSVDSEANPMDKLLAKLSEQQATITKQHVSLASVEDDIGLSRPYEYVTATSSGSVPITPIVDTMETPAPTTSPSSLDGDERLSQANVDEVLRLKLELEKAKGKIARMDEELTQSRITKHTVEQVIGSASEMDFPLGPPADASDERRGNLNNSLSGIVRPQSTRDSFWAGQDDGRSDISEALSATGFNRARAIWGNANRGQYSNFQGTTSSMPTYQPLPLAPGFPAEAWMGRDFDQSFAESAMSYDTSMSASRGSGDRANSEQDSAMTPQGLGRSGRGGKFNNRIHSGFGYPSRSSSFENPISTAGYGISTGAIGGIGSLGLGINGTMGYQPQPIGTPLSPYAPEFTSSTGAPWKTEVRLGIPVF